MDEPSPVRRAELIADCVEAWHAGDAAALDRGCAEHPELAADIRAAARALRDVAAAGGDGAATGRVPERVGRFAIAGRIGQGAMGVVLRGRDAQSDREVAIKLLPQALASSPEAVERSRREIRALRKLHHPHIVEVVEVGETEDRVPYLAMRLVDGEPLSAILRRVRATAPEARSAADLRALGSGPSAAAGGYVEAAVRMLATVAEALHHAHLAGVVHRDVKPANILVDRDGEPYVADFGVARLLDTSTMTATGNEVGTPCYMAPEQVRADRGAIGPATDVYGIGATLYEVLALQPPFRGETEQHLYDAILRREPAPLRAHNPLVPRGLEVVCGKALEKRPRRRYASAAALAQDLRALLALQPIVARAPGRMTRAVRLARRHPRATLAGAALLLAAIGAATLVVVERLRAAHGAIVAFDRQWAALAQLESQVETGRKKMATLDYIESSAAEDLVHAERRLPHQRLAVETSFAAAVGALQRMEWWPLVRADEQLLDLYARRWRVEEARNRAPATVFEAFLREHGSEAVEGRRRVTLEIAPADAAAYLFAYVEQVEIEAAGEVRMVPVPCRANGEPVLPLDRGSGGERPPFVPGDVVLVVDGGTEAAPGSLCSGDLVLRVAGQPIEGTMLVLSVQQDGPAARAGVCAHDRLVALRPASGAEVAVTGEYDLEESERALGAGSAFEAVFRRGERELVVAARRTRTVAADLGVELGSPEGVFSGRRAAPVTVLALAGGQLRAVALAPSTTGPRVARTAYPLSFSAENRVDGSGVQGRVDLVLPNGSYLCVLRRAGYEDLRLPFFVEHPWRLAPGDPERDALSLPCVMNAAGTTPEGFVFVAGGRYRCQGDPVAVRDPESGTRAESVVDRGAFWIGRTEVTIGDWIEFIDSRDQAELDRLTAMALDELDADEQGGMPVVVPRSRTEELEWLWTKQAGRYRPVDRRWRPDWPVGGLSFFDARAYCAWRTARARERGEPWTYELPKNEQWEKAARGADGRFFVWGNFFHPHYCNSRRARHGEPRPEPVLRFVRDESPFGVANLTGGALEWCGDYAGAVKGPQLWKGGGFRGSSVNQYRAASLSTGQPWRPGSHDGFRLLAVRTPD